MTSRGAQAPLTALILTGGGARAAYQAGVLQAIRELSPADGDNPFPILCGTSAGAINAAVLACWADDFGAGVDALVSVWGSFRAADVYRADALGIGVSGARWLGALAAGWLVRSAPRSLLDNSPLQSLLERLLDFERMRRAIAHGTLHSLSVTCSGYETGQSVSFFEGRPDLEPWRRNQRVGAHVGLTVAHLMASSAIPFIFPAVRLHREWFGDGSMRQTAPISPAVHLGAQRILVVGAGRAASEAARPKTAVYPSLAQIAGHAMSSIFLDNLSADIERAARINQTVTLIPPEVREASGVNLRPIEVLVITPSQRLDEIAAQHAHALPWAVRTLLGGVGAMQRRGGALTSYLLFEREYTRALIALGHADTMARADEVREFLANA